MRLLVLVFTLLASPAFADSVWVIDAKPPKVGCPHPTEGRLGSMELKFYSQYPPYIWEPVGVVSYERRIDVDVFEFVLEQSGFYFFKCFNCEEDASKCIPGEWERMYYHKLPEPEILPGFLGGVGFLWFLRKRHVS